MTIHFVEKAHLSAKGMLTRVHSIFKQIPMPDRDPQGVQPQIPLVDCFMPGLAVFGLKYPPLLQFDQSTNKEVVKHNLKSLYHIMKLLVIHL